MSENKTNQLQQPPPRVRTKGQGFSIFEDQAGVLESLALRGITKSVTVQRALDAAGICDPAYKPEPS